MKKSASGIILILIVLSALICPACNSQPKKEAKIEIASRDFFIEQLSDYSYAVYARGTVRNAGEVDVKKVVVTGACTSCANGLAPGKWTIAERERAPNEVDVINYIVAGGEAEFSFEDVAVMYNTVPEKPESMPEDLKILITSYEIVE